MNYDQKRLHTGEAFITRVERLLDTQAHFYHHCSQLHAMLVHVLKREPNVKLFE